MDAQFLTWIGQLIVIVAIIAGLVWWISKRRKK